MLIEVYSDLVCPSCYIGERRLGKALCLRPDLEIERRWRPFRLRPEMSAEGVHWRDFAIETLGGEERVRAAFAQVLAASAPDGIDFRFDRVTSAPNNVETYRLILCAANRGSSGRWPTPSSRLTSSARGLSW
jgi:predicted DsbA family dithiol-disulfide isomerase